MRTIIYFVVLLITINITMGSQVIIDDTLENAYYSKSGRPVKYTFIEKYNLSNIPNNVTINTATVCYKDTRTFTGFPVSVCDEDLNVSVVNESNFYISSCDDSCYNTLSFSIINESKQWNSSTSQDEWYCSDVTEQIQIPYKLGWDDVSLHFIDPDTGNIVADGDTRNGTLNKFGGTSRCDFASGFFANVTERPYIIVDYTPQPCDYSGGQWVIHSDCIIEDTEYTLSGNITIEDGYSLTLNNVTILFNSSEINKHNINMGSGTTFTIDEGSVLNASGNITFINDKIVSNTINIKNSKIDDIMINNTITSGDQLVIENNTVYVYSQCTINNNSVYEGNESWVFINNIDGGRIKGNMIYDKSFQTGPGSLGKKTTGCYVLVNGSSNIIIDSNVINTWKSNETIMVLKSNYINLTNNDITAIEAIETWVTDNLYIGSNIINNTERLEDWNVTNTYGHGIWIRYSNNLTVEDNTIYTYNSSYTLTVWFSENITVNQNRVYDLYDNGDRWQGPLMYIGESTGRINNNYLSGKSFMYYMEVTFTQDPIIMSGAYSSFTDVRLFLNNNTANLPYENGSYPYLIFIDGIIQYENYTYLSINNSITGTKDKFCTYDPGCYYGYCGYYYLYGSAMYFENMPRHCLENDEDEAVANYTITRRIQIWNGSSLLKYTSELGQDFIANTTIFVNRSNSTTNPYLNTSWGAYKANLTGDHNQTTRQLFEFYYHFTDDESFHDNYNYFTFEFDWDGEHYTFNLDLNSSLPDPIILDINSSYTCGYSGSGNLIINKPCRITSEVLNVKGNVTVIYPGNITIQDGGLSCNTLELQHEPGHTFFKMYLDSILNITSNIA